GVDIGTSSVKLILVNQGGEIVQEVSKGYSVIQHQSGYSEQNPDIWVEKTIEGLSELVNNFDGSSQDIYGISFSGQMHGLILIDKDYQVLRNAILWNDTRTTKECKEIEERVGNERLLSITQNKAQEGFTLAKLLWVRKHEPSIFSQSKLFMLPKDYVRYKLTGQIHTDYSDAAGTLMLDINKKKWSEEICDALNIDIDICPSIIESHSYVGKLKHKIMNETGLSINTSVFTGGADNACSAIGAGILEKNNNMVSIGTSGVILTHEENKGENFQGEVHYFNHCIQDEFYSMGVTLAAGYSLNWFRETFAQDKKLNELLDKVDKVPAGSNGLLFTPYIVGERSPHINANIRGSFIGIDSNHTATHFVRSIMEGVTFSLKESLEIFKKSGKKIDTVISVGGGAKSKTWLQMQANIFNTKVIKLRDEQGAAKGAAILAAYGVGWFHSLKDCARSFGYLNVEKIYYPEQDKLEIYNQLFTIYKDIYPVTFKLNNNLKYLRNDVFSS